MDYAVIQTGGKQYAVSEGEVLKIERLDGEKGSRLIFHDVRLVRQGDKFFIGTPCVSAAKVTGELLSEEKAAKLLLIKKRRRKGSRKKQGHRQILSRVRIDKIEIAG